MWETKWIRSCNGPTVGSRRRRRHWRGRRSPLLTRARGREGGQGGRMFSNSEELLKYIKDEGVEMVDVRFCDLPGVMQHFTVPVSSFDQSVFDDGLNFDGSSIRGFQAIHESDMSLFPDPTTAYLDPFRTAK